MGKIFSTVKHPFRNFNLEYRAHKMISQPKPIPAPLHEKDQIDVERLMKEFPDVYEKSLQKNETLDMRLKDIFVTSHDPNVAQKVKQNPEKPLPTDRKAVENFLYGVKQSEKIPLGKVSLATVLEFITNHQGDPQKYSAKKISEDCLLPEEKVNSILKYFKVFEIYIPLERTTKSRFAGPSEPKVHIIEKAREKLPPPDAKEKE